VLALCATLIDILSSDPDSDPRVRNTPQDFLEVFEMDKATFAKQGWKKSGLKRQHGLF
jgi:hypothetical protein